MSYTLLLADDSVTIQRVIELTFAAEDISVVAFSDGEHAIKALDRTRPDIVLADVGMPGRSGYEVAQYVKSNPALSHIPVLLLTGAFEPVDQARALEAGCDGVLIKPFEPQVVIDRVKELLGTSKPGTKAAEVETYFEELDQAFATLAGGAPPPARPVDLTPADGQEAFDPARAAAVPERRALADAFAALLAAERSASKGETPSSAPAPTAGSRALSSDDLIERVARRVLEHLSDTIVRETVADIVHATAEGLIREEIERIKSNIK
jgi:CheY-like chemotaxis protein